MGKEGEDENASNSWQWVTYNLDIHKENVCTLGGLDTVQLISDTAASVQPFAGQQAFRRNGPACAYCKSRFTDRIY